MAEALEYRILGDDLQLVEFSLKPGEAVRAENGAMIYMGEGVAMQTSTGGVFKGVKRLVVGESFFIPTFTYSGRGRGVVAFGPAYPGKIIPISLSRFEGTFYCQKNAFLCASQGIEIEIALTRRLGTGLFGGEGFVLEKLVGDGLAFIHAGGMIVEKELGDGETLRVDTGAVVGFSPSIDYDIQFIGGLRNALFSSEGIFLARLRGPGLVYLQSLPLSRLRAAMRITKG